MENQNNIAQPNATQSQSAQQAQASAQTPTVTPRVSNPMAREQFVRVREKFNSFSRNTKILIITLTVSFLIIFLLLILVALFGKKNVTYIAPSPTPVVQVTNPPEVILNASRYATDEGVLKIESEIKNISKQIDGTDVKQSDFGLPSIDFNINFNR